MDRVLHGYQSAKPFFISEGDKRGTRGHRFFHVCLDEISKGKFVTALATRYQQAELAFQRTCNSSPAANLGSDVLHTKAERNRGVGDETTRIIIGKEWHLR